MGEVVSAAEFTRGEMIRDTCYHEAAHAVFHYHAFGFLGLPIRYVSVATEEHPERMDICMGARPLEPNWSHALSAAADSLAAEWAVYKRRGWELPVEPFAEFVEQAVLEEEEELGVWDEGGKYHEPDEVATLRMLRLTAEFWRETGGIPGAPLDLAQRYATLEGCYEEACRLAILNLDCWWPEIVSVAEGLLAAGGYLDGDQVVKIIESAYEEEK